MEYRGDSQVTSASVLGVETTLFSCVDDLPGDFGPVLVVETTFFSGADDLNIMLSLISVS